MAADEPRWEKPQAATFACKFDVVLSQPQRDRAPVRTPCRRLVGEAHFVRALVSGSTALSASAGEALDKAIGVADAQRWRRPPCRSSAAFSAGSWRRSPRGCPTRRPRGAARSTRARPARRSCGSTGRCGARTARFVTALDLRRSYVLFLGVGKDDGDPEAVAAGLARWGRGAFAAFLEFAPALRGGGGGVAALALPELLLMMGHLAHYARDDPHLLDLLDLYRPVQHAAEARYEPSKKNDRPREELAAASPSRPSSRTGSSAPRRPRRRAPRRAAAPPDEPADAPPADGDEKDDDDDGLDIDEDDGRAYASV
ncbi:endonuclease [Aureococcus anophagefferens]|nr:endonuclease [Aureococcus anophagefferens]